MRVILATIVSPLWAPLYTALFAIFLVPELAIQAADWSLLYRMSIHFSFGLVYGYIPMIFLAIPAHFVLRRVRRQSAPYYVLTWMLLSFKMWAVLHVIDPTNIMESSLRHQLWITLFFTIPWLLSGISFWAIVKPMPRRLNHNDEYQREDVLQLPVGEGQRRRTLTCQQRGFIIGTGIFLIALIFLEPVGVGEDRRFALASGVFGAGVVTWSLRLICLASIAFLVWVEWLDYKEWKQSNKGTEGRDTSSQRIGADDQDCG